ncbi:tetratricopeptide repeat protein [candidate division KSB1 bacterium]|nr:tetratricopeptide repeat protein [candidate division KSB1 bacterium]
MEQIKHYKILELLGSGGMGEVYKAFDTVLERDVAIKIMHRHLLDDKKTDARFMREARAAAGLVHPNIVTIHEVGKTKVGRYIVMEYVAGAPLTRFLRLDEVVEPETTIKLTTQILNGLQCAHSRGVLHRDIKPDNVLVTQNEIAKILDFGIAKVAAKEGLTAAGDILGTVEYMAPEQMLGETTDHRCDLYAAGVVLYQLLTKRLPFVGENPVAILYKILNEDPVPPSYYNKEVKQELDDIVLRAISKSKEERWESAEAFAQAMEAVLRSGTYPSSFATVKEDADPVSGLEPMNSSGARKPQSVFVGREKEFKRLVNLFSQASREEGQTVIVSGEAGVGKSTLANRLRTYAQQNGACVLYGACLYQEGMDAYLPFIDALRDLLKNDSTHMSEEERQNFKKLLREKVPFLQEFVERINTRLGPLSTNLDNGDAGGDAMFDGIYQLISVLSTMRPVLFIIDDLHWADEASLRLFHYLSRHVMKNRVMLVGISRSERYDLQKDGKPTLVVDTLARIRREGECEQITLYRMNKESIERLIDQTLAPAMFTEEFYELVYNETKGNPLFVQESLKLMRESGAIFFNDGAWYNKQEGLQIAVPNRVEDVFLRRLSALSDEECETLQVASVIGFKFDPSQLAKLLEITRIKLLKKLQRVESELQIIVSTETGYQFEHPMLRDMLYQEIPLVLRREYHLMIAADLEVIHDGEYGALVGEVAQHLRCGGEHEKATPLLYQAAMRSFKLGAYREAGVYFSDFADSDERSGGKYSESASDEEIYLKLGRCHEETGRWDEGLAAYKMLQSISEKKGHPKGQVNALERIGRIQAKQGDLDNALASYTRCLEIAQEHNITGVLSSIYNSLGIIHYQKGRLDEALDSFRKTMQLLDGEDGENYKASALLNIGIIANIRSDYQSALESYQKALEIYELKLDRKNQARIYHNIGMTYSDTGEWQKSIEAYQRSLELTDKVEDKQLRALIHLNMGKAFAQQGDFTAAEKSVKVAMKMSKLMGDVLTVAEAYRVYGMIHGLRGNMPEAELYLKESIEINQQKEYLEGLAETYDTYGMICLKNGDLHRSRGYFHEAAATYEKLNLQVKAQVIREKMLEINEQEV